MNVPPGNSLTFTGPLAVIWGFNPGEKFAIPQSSGGIMVRLPHPANIHGGQYRIFVYNNIVNYQVVGDAHMSLLCSKYICNNRQTLPLVLFARPHYTALSKSIINDIEMSLKNYQNQHMPFLYRKILVKLHFRPVKGH